MGTFRVRFTLKASQNVLVAEGGQLRVKSVLDRDVVWIGDIASPITSPRVPATTTSRRGSDDRGVEFRGSDPDAAIEPA